VWKSAPFSSSLLRYTQYPHPLCCMSFSVPCLLSTFFCVCGGVRLSSGLCRFIPWVAVGILHFTYLFTCCSASPKQVWSWCLVVQEPSYFLSLAWHGEDLYGVGVRVLEFCFFLVGVFFEVCLQCLSKIFDLWISCYLLLPSIRHLVSSQIQL
jgi:hypothetical protein